MNSPTLTVELWRDYTADSPLHHEGLTDVTVIGVDPNRADPILVDTDATRGHIPTYKFCANLTIPEKYEECGASTKFVPRGVIKTTQGLFDNDHCHFCDSILDHHHHVSYRPETVLPVCQGCHRVIHNNPDSHQDFTPKRGRPNNYDSSFKRLWKKYRYAVGGVEYFYTDDGFDHRRPSPPTERHLGLLRRMGLLGGGEA